MSEPLEHTMREDRLMRDAARALVDADIANLRADIAARSIPTRMMDRFSEGAADVLDEAVAVADDNKGAVATLIAAILLWFARHPIIELFTGPDGDAEREAADNR